MRILSDKAMEREDKKAEIVFMENQDLFQKERGEYLEQLKQEVEKLYES